MASDAPARRRRALLAAALLAAPLGCTMPGGGGSSLDAGAAQAVSEIADAVNDLRAEQALLQTQVDSLREALARSDSAVTRLSQMAGMP